MMEIMIIARRENRIFVMDENLMSELRFGNLVYAEMICGAAEHKLVEHP